MECNKDKFMVYIGEKFFFIFIVDYFFIIEVIMIIVVLQYDYKMDLMEGRDWLFEDFYDQLSIIIIQEIVVVVRVICEDMVVWFLGIYWIKVCVWVLEVVIGFKWEFFIFLIVI